MGKTNALELLKAKITSLPISKEDKNELRKLVVEVRCIDLDLAMEANDDYIYNKKAKIRRELAQELEK
jgi:hypothetical protein